MVRRIINASSSKRAEIEAGHHCKQSALAIKQSAMTEFGSEEMAGCSQPKS
jgi:hypothetical protein